LPNIRRGWGACNPDFVIVLLNIWGWYLFFLWWWPHSKSAKSSKLQNAQIICLPR
jgi:hypothetical protein